MKSAGARVREFAGGKLNLEETLALNREVQRIAGGVEVALLLENFGGSGAGGDSIASQRAGARAFRGTDGGD